jgi:hypothetical protein
VPNLRYHLRHLVESQRARGTISVRSSANHRFLWFHIVGVSVDYDIATRIRQLYSVVNVDPRTDYLCVEVANEADWKYVLPSIVATFKQWHPKRNVPVRVRPHFDPRHSNWQETLLAEHYTEAEIQPVSDSLKRSVMTVVTKRSSDGWITGHEILHRLNWRVLVLHSGDLYRALQQLVAEGRLESRYQETEVEYRRSS